MPFPHVEVLQTGKQGGAGSRLVEFGFIKSLQRGLVMVTPDAITEI